MPRQMEAPLSALIESTEDFVWSVDLNFGLQTYNRVLQQDFEVNFGTQAAVGKRPEELLPPELAAMWPPLYRRALEEGPFRIDLEFENGRTMELGLNPIMAEGKAVGVSVFGTDITERRASETARVEAERKYSEIFDGTRDGMYQTTPEGVCLITNPAMAKMLRYDSPAECTTAITDSARQCWVNPEDRAEYRRLLEENGTILGYESRFKCKDGSQIWVSLNTRKVCAADGQTLYYEGFVQDITERKTAEKRLQDSEERFRETFEQAAVGILHATFEGRIQRCNARFAEILGYSIEEIVGKTFQDFTPLEYRVESAETLRQLVSGASSTTGLEKPYQRKDGTLTWVKVTSSIQRDGKGKPLHLVTFLEDINERRAAQQELERTAEALQINEARYRAVFQMSLDALCITLLSDGTFLEANQAALDLMGYTREDVIGTTSIKLGFWPSVESRGVVANKLLAMSTVRDERVQLGKKGGELFWASMSASLIEIEGKTCVYCVIRDLSEAMAAEEKIETLAFFDSVTSLPNRRMLLDRLSQALAGDRRSNRKKALLYIDLDGFKPLNDMRGHQTGDLLLQEVARRLSGCVRATDTIGRFAGDEFLVMLNDLSETEDEAGNEAEVIGEKILAVLREPSWLVGHSFHGSASIGITVFGEGRESTNEVLQQANIAMHEAKTAGGNGLRFFEPALQAKVNARVMLREDLSAAISHNEFELYYQPQVDGKGLIGMEALMRWNHPKRGLVGPNEFIPLAEETGLVFGLGAWALETACRQIAVWQEGGVKVPVAVNISARQFSDPEFVEKVLATLERTKACPNYLKLELTESLLANDMEDVIAKMNRLKAHGVSLALDDFGTGYSSLSYLKRLPLDQLKIDRAFVQDILTDVASAAIAQTIISLGRAMGLSVIAEGVETEDQRKFLASLGADSFQGFLFGRPLPLVELEKAWMA